MILHTYDELNDIFLDPVESNHSGRAIPYFDHLIGLDTFKKEMQAVVSYAEKARLLKKTSQDMLFFPIHYIFSISEGMGLSTILEAFTDHMERCGIIKNRSYREYSYNTQKESESSQDDNILVLEKSSHEKYYVTEDCDVISVKISDVGNNLSSLLKKLWAV